MFNTRPGWKSLHPPFLRALANRLAKRENVVPFIITCEKTGFLKDKVPAIAKYSLDDTYDYSLSGFALLFTTYATALGKAGHFTQADSALELALVLSPTTPTAWASRALVKLSLHDPKSASFWANKVLAFEPNAESENPIEQAAAAYVKADGMDHSWDEIKQQMKAVLVAVDQQS